LPFCHVTLRRQILPPGYPKEPKTVGDYLRMRRLDLDFTQREVAEQLRVHPASLRNWELNHGRPNSRYLPAIRTFLGHPSAPFGLPLPDRLRFARWALNLSQRDFARHLEVNRCTLSAWEVGRHLRTRRHRERIEHFLALQEVG
jgi:DNA-binding transcriptional regulator YiaG